jgi:hypothetical protein
MSLIRLISASMVISFSLACAGDGIFAPPIGFTHAVAGPDCGPAGRPALAIYLTRDPAIPPMPLTPPLVRIYLAQSVTAISGRTWTLAGTASDGNAWFQSAPSNSPGLVQPPELATGGYMIVTSVGSDNTIEGTVDLTFPSGEHIRGGFRAPWVLPNVSLCV